MHALRNPSAFVSSKSERVGQGFPVLPLSITHADKKQLLQRYKEAMALFEPAAIVSDSRLACKLLEHRPHLRIISPQILLFGACTAEG